uniref:Uncharacterized protein LOC113791005 n=1 Tax=Dermatophagoides pteronyssinus TaxID=6956 RepID=A0A6P6XSV6_DERPT|nr:uncharacterized protein LOC113791005 [Dermatophagoides pteronyssinus]
MSIIYIKQFDWIQDYSMYQAMTGLFPKDGLHYLMQGLIIWSLNSMINGFYASSRRFEDYDFLLPIRYEKYRKLNDKNQKKFNLLRDRIFSMTPLYHVASIVFIIQYYYNLRQKSFIREIDKHNHQLKRFVSVIFTSITVTITFLVYLITMTEQNIIFICLYLVVLHSHYMILILLIIASDIIKDNNEKILRLKRKCLSLSTLDKKIFLNRQLFKYESITSTLLNRPSGFQLTNGIIITSYTFVTFIFNIIEL